MAKQNRNIIFTTIAIEAETDKLTLIPQHYYKIFFLST